MERTTEGQKRWRSYYIAVGDVVLMSMTLSALLIPQLEIEDMQVEPHQTSEIDTNPGLPSQYPQQPRSGCLHTP